MAAAPVDLAAEAHRRIVENPEAYIPLILRRFGHYLFHGADADDDGEALDNATLDWREMPELFALSAAEQDIVYAGALRLLHWDDAPLVLKQMLIAWFDEGAPS